MPAITEAESAHLGLTRLLAAYWPIAVAALGIVVLARSYFNKGLNRYPGPFLANFTDAWRTWDVTHDKHHETLLQLHNKYGPVVRTGPNTVDISDPEYVPTIYGVNKGFLKSAAYDIFNHASQPPNPTIFSTRDERFHTQMKRDVAGIYSLSSLQEYEPLVDEMILVFVDRLQQEFDGPTTKGRPCDLASWMQYYAFDVILNLVFGNTLGFMAQGADAGSFIEALYTSQNETALCTQMPWLRYVNRANPLRRWLKRESTVFPAFVRQQIGEHGAKMSASFEKKPSSEPQTEDLLTRFMKIPDLPQNRLMAHTLVNVFAGSDTTGITLRAVMYFLLRDPRCMAELMKELRTADPPLSYPVTWKESQRLTYLGAVMQETLRLFPAVALSLGRTVPPTGLAMPDGYVLPGGTDVGMNAYIVHRDQDVFGPLPAGEFHPERWLQGPAESSADFSARMSRMRRSDLAFGGGQRICLGRNISFLEIYKVIPTLLLEFDIALVDPAKEWSVSNRFFNRQSGMDCTFKRRVNRA